MSDLIEPQLISQLPSASLPIQDTDLVVLSRDGQNLVKSTASEIISRANVTKLNGIATGATANSSDSTLLNRANHTGTQAIATVTGLQTELDNKQPLSTVLTNTTASFTTADETKLDGIAAGATANSTDAALLNRANHTGTQLSATISDLTETVQDIVGAQIVGGVGITTTYDDALGTETIALAQETELAITASRNALATDIGTIITNNTTNNIVYTITTAFQPPAGYVQSFYQANTGALTVAAGSGITLEGAAPIAAADTHFSLRYRGGNVWAWVGVSGQLTSGVIKYQQGAILAAGTPNTTLTDSIGTTDTQIGFVTIPGGAMGPNSQLEIVVWHTKILNTALDTKIKLGSASGSYATATNFGGQFGLTTQRSIFHIYEIWNTGTLNNQLASATGQFLPGANNNPAIATTIDTSIDWNIYFGVQYTVAPVTGDTVTLRKFRIAIHT